MTRTRVPIAVSMLEEMIVPQRFAFDEDPRVERSRAPSTNLLLPLEFVEAS